MRAADVRLNCTRIMGALSIPRIAFINLLRRPTRSVALAAIVAVSSIFLFSGTFLDTTLADSLADLSGRLGADALIVPQGYENSTQSILLRGDPGMFYMSAEILSLIATDVPGIARITPQFFLSTFDADCCDAKVQVIGFDPATDFLVTPWAIKKEQVATVTNGEIVVGARITAEPGETLLFYAHRYRVKAKLHPTGLGLDTSILMPMSGVYDIIRRTPNLLPALASNPGGYLSAIAIKAAAGYSPYNITTEILKRYRTSYAIQAVETARLVSDISNHLKRISLLSHFAAVVFWLLAALVLAFAFTLTLNERKRELSLLRILGAPRRWVLRLVTTEGMVISVFGALAGIGFAVLVLTLFSPLICATIVLPNLTLPLRAVLSNVPVTLIPAIASGTLAGAWAARRITRFDVYDTFRVGE